MRYVRTALLTGLTLGAVVVALLLLSGSTATDPSPSPSASIGDFTPLQPNLSPAAKYIGERSIGVADAPVTLEVWTDYQCPICGAWANGIEPILYERYVTEGKLRIVHHDFAFLGEESVAAATGAACAEQQGNVAFWSFHSYLFANQNGENKGWFSGEHLRAIAEASGLDVTLWESCSADLAVRSKVLAETDAAHALGVSATPTLRIGDWMSAGLPTIDEITSRISAALAP